MGAGVDNGLEVDAQLVAVHRPLQFFLNVEPGLGALLQFIIEHAPFRLAHMLGLVKGQISVTKHCAAVLNSRIKKTNADGCRRIGS